MQDPVSRRRNGNPDPAIFRLGPDFCRGHAQYKPKIILRFFIFRKRGRGEVPLKIVRSFDRAFFLELD